MNFSTVSKGIAGAVASTIVGNGTLLASMPAAQAEAMPWWGYLIATVIYASIGFIGVYIAPKNTAS